MPPPDARQQLDAADIAQIGRWIEAGAAWNEHWAFTPVRRPQLPAVRHQAWPRNAIDYFILRRLESEQLEPSPPADRRTLLRRVTFDLTGLPPTPAEVQAFLADRAPGAYERVVDRLLASPRYGERFATRWLDAARYADTNGYFMDNGREMWAWRDWVVRALNAGMPFDQFTLEQLAGDLLPHATRDQRLASGFHRNHGINFEAGAIDAECRVAYVVDRTNTTGALWLGLTVGCARCHDHPYDPISQEAYYRMYAFFNHIDEEGVAGHWGNAAPLLSLPTPDEEHRLDELQRELARVDNAIRADLQAADTTPKNREEAASPVVSASGHLPAPAAHYALDDAEGYDVHNANGPDAELDGRDDWIEGPFGGALAFHGNTSIDCGDALEIDATTPFTCSAWVFPATPQGGTLFARMDGTDADTFRGFELAVRDGELVVRLVHSHDQALVVAAWAGTATVAANHAARLPTGLTGKWSHIAVTYDGSMRAAGVAVYVNGRRVPCQPMQDDLEDDIAVGVPLRIGRREEVDGVAEGRRGEAFDGAMDDVRFYDTCLTSEQVARLARTNPLPESDREGKAEEMRDDRRRAAAFLSSTAFARRWNEHTRLEHALHSLQRQVTTAMVMRERPGTPSANVLTRGLYDHPGKRVSPGTFDFVAPFPDDAPANRLGLARWIVAPENPLTPRVAMNRAWQAFFGRGLVATMGDFGTQGDRPSHPELLDWLAHEFVRRGWDMKAMHRMIVLSATYRQASIVPADAAARDPRNRWLAHMPRRRLTAEMVRDAALAYGGLLSPRMGGPGVSPYQPPGLWKANSFRAGYTAQEFHQSHGEGLYRRSLYTFWKRTCPPPSMAVFDAPSRERCILQRNVSNTPLQALVLLNDVTYTEAARGLAARVMKETGGDSARVHRITQIVLSRPAEDGEVRVLIDLLVRSRDRFTRRSTDALRLQQVGESLRGRELDAVELAAWTVVAATIMNLDEALMRN